MKLRFFAGLSVDETAEVLGICAHNRLSPLDLRPRLAPAKLEDPARSFAARRIFSEFLGRILPQFSHCL